MTAGKGFAEEVFELARKAFKNQSDVIRSGREGRTSFIGTMHGVDVTITVDDSILEEIPSSGMS